MLNPSLDVFSPALEINSSGVPVFSTSLIVSSMVKPLEILTCAVQKRDGTLPALQRKRERLCGAACEPGDTSWCLQQPCWACQGALCFIPPLPLLPKRLAVVCKPHLDLPSIPLAKGLSSLRCC